MSDSTARLTWESLTLKLRHPFRISYGVSETRRAFWLRLASDEGWGEATIPSYYHVSEADMFACWAAAAQRREPLPDDPAEVTAWIGAEGPAPARCGLDMALHDRIARQRNVPLHQLLGVAKPSSVITAFTISMDEPAEMARAAARVPEYPIIKLKLGSDDDVARVAAVRAARPDVRLYVDANAGWSPAEAVAHIRALEPYRLELIEQPVAKDDIAGLGYVQAHTEVPIVADESVQSLADMEKAAAAGVKGVNLKLMKVGGLAPCLQMLHRARELGLRVMLGCMVESSLGVAAMAHLAAGADWVDLDGPLLIANDPFTGLTYDRCQISLPDRAGIGVAVGSK